jgi:antitoxin (DNA-binding transcriptional repressor) of toxin-antitoxin stability system
MKFVTTHEAKTHLSALLQDVIHGETIVISRGKKRLVSNLRICRSTSV